MKLRNVLAIIVAALVLVSCVEVNNGPHMKTVKLVPTKEKYNFIAKDPTLKNHYHDLYSSKEGEKTYISAQITSPVGYKIKFNNDMSKHDINEYTIFKMSKGVYPFELYSGNAKEPSLVGAIAAFNIDKEIELATFGLTDDTRMFNMEMLEKAEDGVLASYTISFDDRDVIHYWLGNRDDFYTGGKQSVELDFSKTANLKEVSVDNKKLKQMKSVLGVGASEGLQCEYCDITIHDAAAAKGPCQAPKSQNPTGIHSTQNTWENVDYTLKMSRNDGKSFQGYVRYLRANAYTAFLSIPCEIPEELFQQAAEGTIAKLSIFDTADEKLEIAQLVFGLAK